MRLASLCESRFFNGENFVLPHDLCLDGPGLWFGNEEKAMANACRNRDFTKFTNSFLGMWEKGKA